MGTLFAPPLLPKGLIIISGQRQIHADTHKRCLKALLNAHSPSVNDYYPIINMGAQAVYHDREGGRHCGVGPHLAEATAHLRTAKPPRPRAGPDTQMHPDT